MISKSTDVSFTRKLNMTDAVVRRPSWIWRFWEKQFGEQYSGNIIAMNLGLGKYIATYVMLLWVFGQGHW